MPKSGKKNDKVGRKRGIQKRRQNGEKRSQLTINKCSLAREWGFLRLWGSLKNKKIQNEENADTSSAPDGTTATTAGGSDSSEAEGGAGKFGSIESPCGPGDAKVKADQAGAGADKLYIGVANDRTSIRNGLLKELFDGATGFAKWCNEQGGVAGLPVEVVDMDGKLFEIEGVRGTAWAASFSWPLRWRWFRFPAPALFWGLCWQER